MPTPLRFVGIAQLSVLRQRAYRMFEFIIITAILFGGGLAFGFVTGRRSCVALPLAVVLGVVAAVCIKDEWSGYRTMSAHWSEFLYASFVILIYFALFIGPATLGALVGILIRRSCHASHTKDGA